jgi:hypothetical protein
MSTIHRSRTIVSAVAAMVMVALSAPIAVHAEDPVVPVEEQALAPASIPGPSVSVADSRVSAAQQALLSPDLGSMQEEALLAVVATAMSWDQTSGYGVLEASRAAAAALYAPVAGPTWDETSGYGMVEAIRAEPDVSVAPATGTTADAASGVGSGGANRVTNAEYALRTGDLGSMQEDALTAIVAAGASWDDTSGYRALEASRATIGHPAVSTTAATIRLVAAQQALLSGDLGSMQEEALAAVMAASSVGDDASVDEALAATRAALLAQFRAVELSSSRFLGADQHLQSCAAAS